jgi:predicted nucleic-acid-binding Zn-ribbon protein
MNETEVKKCPKCGGEMKKGYVRATGAVLYPVHFAEKISFWGGGNDKNTCAFACKTCGYLEFYIDKKE